MLAGSAFQFLTESRADSTPQSQVPVQVIQSETTGSRLVASARIVAEEQMHETTSSVRCHHDRIGLQEELAEPETAYRSEAAPIESQNTVDNRKQIGEHRPSQADLSESTGGRLTRGG